VLGLVFTSLVEMMEEKFSYEFADEVITEAKLDNNGAYTSVGYYKLEELVKMVEIVSHKTNTPVPDLLHVFGHYLMSVIAKGHEHIIVEYPSLFAMLDNLDSEIHVTVLKLYENAQLPKFSIGHRSDTCIELQYTSIRRLEHLALGLLDGAAEIFGEKISVEMMEMVDEEYDVLIRVQKVG
jgi:hypothetical protein